MIQNDVEMKVTQDRILYFQGLVAQFRITTEAPNYELMAGGYLAEIKKMQAEISDYLGRNAAQNSQDKY